MFATTPIGLFKARFTSTITPHTHMMTFYLPPDRHGITNEVVWRAGPTFILVGWLWFLMTFLVSPVVVLAVVWICTGLHVMLGMSIVGVRGGIGMHLFILYSVYYVFVYMCVLVFGVCMDMAMAGFGMLMEGVATDAFDEWSE